MSIIDLYDLFIHNPQITTDSRNCPKGSIFFALKGDKFDGNQYAGKALASGCVYAVIDNPDYYIGERTILHPDQLRLRTVILIQRSVIYIHILEINPNIFVMSNNNDILMKTKAIALFLLGFIPAFAQDISQPAPEKNLVRLSKITVDPAQLERYNAFLKEEIEASMRLEPGVLTLYAVSEKEHPNKVTILEIYADQDAYKNHIQTPHFQKYKQGTLQMVQELELVDSTPLIPGLKIK